MLLKTSHSAVLGLLSGLFMSGVAQAQIQTCSKGTDERTLEILQPGVVGKACDLRYTYNNGATIKTPYHANNSAGFCAQKAQTLLADLSNQGFVCSASSTSVVSTPPETTAPAVASAVVEQEPIETAQIASAPVAEVATAVQAAPVLSAPEQIATDVIDEVANSLNDIRANDLNERQVQRTRAAVQPASAEKVLSQIDIEQAEDTSVSIIPEPAVANRAPVALTSATAVTTNAPVPRKSAVGRLLGADPQEHAPVAEKIAQPAVNSIANEERLALVATQPSPVVEEPFVEKTAVKKVKSQKMRPAPDIIKGVLEAQAAAWNEGDLEAFMVGYWKNADLRFVSGTEVTSGWSQTLKRYKARYGDGGNLGTLSFKKLDVEMITDDVAIVVGRFNLDKDEANSSGVFSLVMKQIEGRWRIVHDHTAADKPVLAE